MRICLNDWAMPFDLLLPRPPQGQMMTRRPANNSACMLENLRKGIPTIDPATTTDTGRTAFLLTNAHRRFTVRAHHHRL